MGHFVNVEVWDDETAVRLDEFLFAAGLIEADDRYSKRCRFEAYQREGILP